MKIGGGKKNRRNSTNNRKTEGGRINERARFSYKKSGKEGKTRESVPIAALLLF